MPKVSVYLTSYNHAKYLNESITSVINQTYSDFELIIADDASTDNSWEIILGFKDPRIKRYRNTINQLGYFPDLSPQELTSEYIAVQHSDDVWEIDKLEKQVAYLDANPEVAAVFTHASIIDEEGKPFSDETHPYYKIFDQPNRTRYEWLRYFFFSGNALCHPSILMRKNYIYVYETPKGIVQLPDFGNWIRLCLIGEIHIVQEKLVRFRVRNNEANTSGNRPDVRIRGQFEVLQLLNQFRSISTIDELINIFPEAENYTNIRNPDVLYSIGMLAVELGSNQPTKLFGLTLLFEAINDPKRATNLEKFNHFSIKDFVILTGKNDVFSVELISDLYSHLSASERSLQALTQQITERQESEQALMAQMAEKDQSLQVYSFQLTEKEQSLQTLNGQMAEKERTLQTLTLQLAHFEQSQQTLIRQLLEKEQSLQTINSILAEKEQSLQMLSDQLHEITGSKKWKTALLLSKISNTLVPRNGLLFKVVNQTTNLFRFKHNRMTKAEKTLISSSGLFDEAWYLARNTDVAKAKIDPLEHYLLHGGFEGRDPGPNFYSAWYLKKNTDVRDSKLNPLVHYLRYGKQEGRYPMPENSD